MTDAPEAAFMRRFKRWVVVGCSATPGKAAHDVPAGMLRRGLDIVPVNPFHERVLDRPTFKTLADLPDWVKDEPFAVQVFRPSAETPGVARAAVAAGASGVWLQLGIAHAQARQAAEEAGIAYIEDRCWAIEIRRYPDAVAR